MDEPTGLGAWLSKYGALCALAIVVIALTPVFGWWRAVVAAFATLAGWAVLMAIIDMLRGKARPSAASHTADQASSRPAGPAAAPVIRGDPPELEAAIAALQAGHHADVLPLAAPWLDSGNAALRADALRLTALAYSQLGEYVTAVPFWERLAALENDSHTWLNVATSRAMAGAFEQADAAFEHMQQRYAIEQGAPEGTRPIDPMAVANYLSALDMAGRADLAVPHLEVLAGFYRSIGSTDSHRLFMYKLPFFSAFLEKSLPILRKVMDEEALAAWYCPIYDAVDDEGKAMFGHFGVPH